MTRSFRMITLAGFLATAMTGSTLLAADADHGIKASQPNAPKFKAVAAKPLAANTSLGKILGEYKTLLKRQAMVRDQFERARHSTNLEGTTEAAAPSAVTTEERTAAIGKAKMEVLVAILNGQSDKGYGDVEYWLRTYNLIDSQALISVDLLNGYLANYGSNINGLLRTAIGNVLSNLDRMARKYEGKNGNSDYWAAASGDVRDACRQAARDLQEIINAMGNPGAQGNLTVDLIKAKLETLQIFLSRQNDKGYGDLEYWTRTHGMLGMQGRLAMSQLDQVIAFADGKTPGLLTTALRNTLRQLSAAVSKYDNGYGDVNYWTKACGDVRDGMHQAASSIVEILRSI